MLEAASALSRQNGLDPALIPEGAAGCMFEACYYFTIKEHPISGISFIPGPNEYVPTEVPAFGDLQTPLSGAVGGLFTLVARSNAYGMAAGLTVDNIKTTRLAVYETVIPVMRYEKVVRYVWPQVKNTYEDKLIRYDKYGTPKRIGEPLRYE